MGDDVIRAVIAVRIGSRLCEPHIVAVLWFDAVGTHNLSSSHFNRSSTSSQRYCGRGWRIEEWYTIIPQPHTHDYNIWRSLSRPAQPWTITSNKGLYRTSNAKWSGEVTSTSWKMSPLECSIPRHPRHIPPGTEHKRKPELQQTRQTASIKKDKHLGLRYQYYFDIMAVETLGHEKWRIRRLDPRTRSEDQTECTRDHLETAQSSRHSKWNILAEFDTMTVSLLDFALFPQTGFERYPI